MLRTMLLACVLALPGLAAAQDFPNAAVGAEVKADDGTVLGHVRQVTRDRHGHVVSAALPNEPADAPAASSDLVADQGALRIPARFAPSPQRAPRETEGGGAGRVLR
ncbi:MAG TPA: hypothetical protein VG943_09510 [Caulobacterales bacterium]|nr:hypothetical protein [Caulobacterales bacterium]